MTRLLTAEQLAARLAGVKAGPASYGQDPLRARSPQAPLAGPLASATG